jgi:hypothetical protein
LSVARSLQLVVALAGANMNQASAPWFRLVLDDGLAADWSVTSQPFELVDGEQ